MGLGIVFSGQGNQYPEMFTKLNNYDQGLIADLKARFGISLIPQIGLSNEELFANDYAQSLIVGYEYMLWQVLKLHIPSPVAMCGYSVGEISAFACAANINLDYTLDIAHTRASLMSACGDGKSGLCAISGLARAVIQDVCSQFSCHIAIVNGLEQCIIGGENTNLASCIDYINQQNPTVKCTKLNVSIASHTPLLSAASENFASYLTRYHNAKLASRVVSGISANVYYESKPLIDDLSRQIQTTVIFDRVIEVMYELGASVILEIGPGTALANIIKKYNLPVKIKSVDDFSSLEGLIYWVNKSMVEE